MVCSIRLVGLGDTLADRTGWGEALFGAVFFGLVTSLSGIVMTAATAAANLPQLAYSNAVGGIAVQTLAIVAADAAHDLGDDPDRRVVADVGEVRGEHAVGRRRSALLGDVAHERADEPEPVPGRPLDVVGAFG